MSFDILQLSRAVARIVLAAQAWFLSPEGRDWLNESSHRTVQGLQSAVAHVRNRQRTLGLRVQGEVQFLDNTGICYILDLQWYCVLNFIPWPCSIDAD